MDWNEAERHLVAGRDDRTEFMPSLDDLSTVGRTICAFANSRGGVLFLGANASGEIVGVEDDPVEVGDWLDDLLDTGFTSPVPATRGRRRCGAGWVHWIDTPSLRFLGGVRFEGGFWMRNAWATLEPSPVEVQRLLRDALAFGRDTSLLRGARPEDLDPEAVRLFLARSGGRSRGPGSERLLDLLGATVRSEGRCYVSLSGLLAFGRSPQAFRPARACTVRCTAYWKEFRDWDLMLSSEVGGRFDEQVRGARRWFDRLGWRTLYDGRYRDRGRLLPPTILSEALANAVAHRDYGIPDRSVRLEVFEDRVEVTSPGSLPDLLSLQSLDRGLQRARNLLAFEALSVAGFTVGCGSGVWRMRSAMRAFNGTEVGFENDTKNQHFRVTLRFGADEEDDR